MKINEIDHLKAKCEKCNRNGFTWARGCCQYCGHKQYEDDLFIDQREFRTELNEKAYEELRKAKKQPIRPYGGSFDIDGGFDDGGGDCSSD